jgi:hypothetical protein
MKHFPSIFLTNDDNISFDENFSKIEINEYFLWYKSNIINFYHTTHNGTEVIAHANPKFIYNLKSLNNFELLESYAEDLNWGLLIYNDKKKKRLVIKNDIYGIYPFYSSELNGKIYFSNDFDLLVNIHQGLTINNFAIADIFLFNYPLLNRTIFKEISRVESFSTIFVKGSDYYIERKDILKVIYTKKKYPFDLSISSIKDVVKRNSIPELKSQLALTGGFDSKLLLSTLLYEGVEFETFTWGNKSTADNLSATKTSINLNLKHNNISQDSLENNPLEYISRLIDYQPNFPVADTLMNYILVNDTLDSSNIFTGIMGGELIVGPIIKAELIATRYASYLTNTKDYSNFYDLLLNDLPNNCVIKEKYIKRNFRNYYESIKAYSSSKVFQKNESVVKFLLTEAYPKFFGTVLNILFSKHNLIAPLVNIKHLQFLLNSKYRFTKSKPFGKNPLSHFLSRRFYANYVEKVYPIVLDTPMDRGYKLYHFKNLFTLIIPAINYIKRHFFKKKTSIKKKFGYIDKLIYFTNEIIDESPVNKIVVLDLTKLKNYILKYKNGYRNNRLTQNTLQVLLLHMIFTKYKDKNITYENN